LCFVAHARFVPASPRPHCREQPLVLSPNAAGRQRKTLGEQPKDGPHGKRDLNEESKSGDPMTIAFAEARSAELRGEAPIGAALVREGAVIASAGNRTRELADPTAHAEMLVIREAAAKIGSERLVGCDLYVTLEPCAMCAGAISLARLRRLYYAAPDSKGGAVDHGPRFFRSPTCHHAPEVCGGLRESEAAAMLKAFFAARR
jgi:tRNA(Arg) A34 adenosine deaminase TadA